MEDQPGQRVLQRHDPIENLQPRHADTREFVPTDIQRKREPVNQCSCKQLKMFGKLRIGVRPGERFQLRPRSLEITATISQAEIFRAYFRQSERLLNFLQNPSLVMAQPQFFEQRNRWHLGGSAIVDNKTEARIGYGVKSVALQSFDQGCDNKQELRINIMVNVDDHAGFLDGKQRNLIGIDSMSYPMV